MRRAGPLVLFLASGLAICLTSTFVVFCRISKSEEGVIRSVPLPTKVAFHKRSVVAPVVATAPPLRPDAYAKQQTARKQERARLRQALREQQANGTARGVVGTEDRDAAPVREEPPRDALADQDRSSLFRHQPTEALSRGRNVSITKLTAPTDPMSLAVIYMVHDRVALLERALRSLQESDVPSDVPVILSVDGTSPKMKRYIESLETSWKNLQIWHHPFDATSIHTTQRDSYGHAREPTFTCARHHWNWIVSQLDRLDTVVLLEEDYVVAPTLYQALRNGRGLLEDPRVLGLGLGPDQTNHLPPHVWFAQGFVTGPMVVSAPRFRNLVLNHAHELCRIDDYNWDWAFVHLLEQHVELPHVLVQPSRPLAKHIGVGQGMHAHGMWSDVELDQLAKIDTVFEGHSLAGSLDVPATRTRQSYGGWAFEEDIAHCEILLSCGVY